MIPVYIIPTSTPVGGDTLVEFFNSSSLFDVQDPPSLTKSIGVNELTSEANLIVSALDDSRKNYPDQYTITIKDTSVTTSNASILSALIIDALSFNGVKVSLEESDSETDSECRKYGSTDSCSCIDTDSSEYISDCNCKIYKDNSSKSNSKRNLWEVAYLADWLDRCDLFRKLSKSTDLTKWVKTFSPNGIQAQLWSPVGRDIVLGRTPMKSGNFFTPINAPLSQKLNKNIELGNISAITTSPPFFYFDETLATLTTDLDKSCFCRQPDSTSPNGAISFAVFAILASLLIVFAWFVYITWGKHY